MFISLINTSFEPIQEIGDAVTLLKTFSPLARRMPIRRCIERRERDVHLFFVRHCHTVREEFDSNRRKPPLRNYEPQYAGAAIWAQSLLISVKNKWNQLKMLGNFSKKIDVEASNIYEKVVNTIQAFQSQRYKDWVDSLSLIETSNLHQRLERVRSNLNFT